MFRRKHPRVKLVSLVSTEPVGEDLLVEFGNLGATLNISAGGVLFESPVPYPLLAVLKVSITLGEEIVEAKGRVVRLEEVAPHKIRVALHFTEIDPKDREKIQRFVEAREQGAL